MSNNKFKQLNEKRKRWEKEHPVASYCLKLGALMGAGALVGYGLGAIYSDGWKTGAKYGYSRGINHVTLPDELDTRILYSTRGLPIAPDLNTLAKFNYPDIQTTTIAETGRVVSAISKIDADKLTDYANEMIELSNESIRNGTHRVYAFIATGADEGIVDTFTRK